jgi:hypothetical protein
MKQITCIDGRRGFEGNPRIITAGTVAEGATYPGWVAHLAAVLVAMGARLVAMSDRCKVVAPSVVASLSGDAYAVARHRKAWGGAVFAGYSEAHRGALYLTCTKGREVVAFDSGEVCPDGPRVVARSAAQGCRQLASTSGYDHDDGTAQAMAVAMAEGVAECAALDRGDWVRVASEARLAVLVQPSNEPTLTIDQRADADVAEAMALDKLSAIMTQAPEVDPCEPGDGAEPLNPADFAGEPQAPDPELAELGVTPGDVDAKGLDALASAGEAARSDASDAAQASPFASDAKPAKAKRRRKGKRS